jgi:hypothetical protein
MIQPPTPVTEINKLNSRVTSLEKKTFPQGKVLKDNVNITFLGNTGLPENDKQIECSLMRLSSTFTLYRVHVELEEPSPKYFSFEVTLNGNTITKVYIPENVTHVKTGFVESLIPSTQGLKIEGVIPTGVGFMTVQLVGASTAVVNQTGLFRLV